MGVTAERIGALRHRITFQTLSLISDGQGGQTQSWTDLVTVWSRVKPIGARERRFTERLETNITHEVTIRHRTDITSEMRFTYDNRIFQIKAPFRFDERKYYLIFDAVEGVPT